VRTTLGFVFKVNCDRLFTSGGSCQGFQLQS